MRPSGALPSLPVSQPSPLQVLFLPSLASAAPFFFLDETMEHKEVRVSAPSSATIYQKRIAYRKTSLYDTSWPSRALFAGVPQLASLTGATSSAFRSLRAHPQQGCPFEKMSVTYPGLDPENECTFANSLRVCLNAALSFCTPGNSSVSTPERVFGRRRLTRCS